MTAGPCAWRTPVPEQRVHVAQAMRPAKDTRLPEPWQVLQMLDDMAASFVWGRQLRRERRSIMRRMAGEAEAGSGAAWVAR